MFLLLLGALPAHAAVNQVGLEQIIAALAPRVRTATGATLSPLPGARVERREVLLAEHKLADSPEKYAQVERILTEDVLAAYDPWDKQVLVIADSFSAALDAARVQREDVDDAVSCIVAHELVHAAQDEKDLNRAPMPDALLAVIEGQADVLSGPLCASGIREQVRAMHGVDVLASREIAGVPLTYGYGGRFVSAWEARFGAGSSWGLLARLEGPNPPAFTTADVIAVGGAGLPGGWRGWTGPEEAARALMPGLVVPAAEVTSPYVLLGPNRKLRADAGLSVRAKDETSEIGVYAWSMVEPTMARLWVELRRAAMAGQSTFLALIDLGQGLFNPPTAPAVKIDGADSAVRLRVSTNRWTYEETWAARGTMLVGVVSRTTKHLDATDAVASLLAGPPAGASTSEPAAAVLDRLAP